jgi:HAD superfamily hydrolase (TIGR01549 family)
MRDRPVLDAVLFDAGGTLVRLDFEWMSEWLATQGLAISAATLRRGEVEGRRRYDASFAPADDDDSPQPLGRSRDARSYIAGTLEAAGVRGGICARALEAFTERQRGPGLWTRPMEGAREALDAVIALGLRRAVVSNSDGRAEQHLLDCGVRDGLEFVIDSQFEGIEKPDPRILRIALDRLGIAAARAIYVGDIRSVDEAVARAAGTHFVLIDPWLDYGEGPNRIASIRDLAGYLQTNFTLIQASTHPSVHPVP